MANLSPAVITREFALDLSVEQAGSATGATVGLFEWGPVEEPVLVNNKNTLLEVFGRPTDSQFVDWFCASNYLSYTNRLFVARVVPDGTGDSTTSENASMAISSAQAADPDVAKSADNTNLTTAFIKNSDDFESQEATLSASTDTVVLAKYPGAFGNRITVSVVSPTNFSAWAYESAFDSIISGNQVAVVVLLDGTIVEQFVGSQDPTAVGTNGGSGYIAEIINRTSSYINVVGANFFTETTTPGTYSEINFTSALEDGSDGLIGTTEDGERQSGWDLFVNPEEIEVDLLFVGGASPTVGQYVDQNIASVRQDCVNFVSPEQSDVVGISNVSTVVTNVVTTRQTFASSSHSAMDGNYKYQYDPYNDKYRWLPLNGDIAGLHAKTDFERDAWWAAAGFQRGHIKNVHKFAYNPAKAFRDELYKNQVNPVSTFQGEGPVFFGNKTLLNSTSSISKINVRRLFNVLKRSISRMAQAYLFEVNDRFTRNQFIQAVDPFLRTVQSRRGVTRYRIVCDESNNTSQVIDSAQFIGDIYITPAIPIETIFLNFIATRNGVEFEEITLNAVVE